MAMASLRPPLLAFLHPVTACHHSASGVRHNATPLTSSASRFLRAPSPIALRRGAYRVSSWRACSSAGPPLPTANSSIAPPDEPCASEATGPDEAEPDDVLETESFRVSAAQSGARIDKLLAEHFTGRSRTYIQSLLSQSQVLLDGEPVSSKSIRPVAGQLISVTFLPVARDAPLTGEAMDLDVLYEDAHLAVLNKRAGIVVHPSAGHWTGTLVHGLLHRYPAISAVGGAERPGIVHRLDKGTSGVIVVARTAEAHAALGTQFAERRVRKEYLAVTVGNPCRVRSRLLGNDVAIEQRSVLVNLPLGRSRQDRTRMTVDAETGREARSTVELLRSENDGLLHVSRVLLHTGRTHQIRVHLAALNCPILGDDLYGVASINKRYPGLQRPMLHARRLSFEHPVLPGQTVRVSAPVPADMQALLDKHFQPEQEAER